jgi:hypothetical protein
MFVDGSAEFVCDGGQRLTDELLRLFLDQAPAGTTRQHQREGRELYNQRQGRSSETALRVTNHWLFVGFSDDRRLFVLRFVAVFVFFLVIIVGIPWRHHVGGVDRPSGSTRGDVCGHIGSC